MGRLTGKTSKPGQQQRHRTSNRELLLRRLEELSQSQSLVDVGLCAEHLRRKYRNDYGRMKQRPFCKLVDEAIQDIKHKQKTRALASPPNRESLLQLQEKKHLRRFHGSNSSSESDSDGSSDEEDSNSDVPNSTEKGEFSNGKRMSRPRISRAGSYSESTDDDEILESDCGFNLLNASLCSTYKKIEASKEEMSTDEPLKSTTTTTPVVQTKVVPAFASPQAIAAAAARACAASKSGKTTRASDDINSNGDAASIKAVNKTQASDDINSKEDAHVMTSDKDTTISTDTQVTTDNSSDYANAKKNGSVKKTDNITKRPVEQFTQKHEMMEKSVPRKRHKTDNKEKVEKVKDVTPSVAEAVNFSDLGGIDSIIGLLREVMFPLYNPGIYSWLGLHPIRGVLLHGPPGCGKTKLANAIAHEAGLPFLKISGPEVVSGMSGESEAKIRNLFSEATRLAPCIIFIDEIDSITSKRENAHREMERRIVTQLMTCMDELNQSFQGENNVVGGTVPSTKNSNHVLIIGATNRPEAVDPALRRPGRFDHEILLGVPDENGRAQILSALSKNLRLEGSFDFKHIARCTPGFVGADLAALTREAGAIAIKRIVSSRDPNLCIANISEFAATTSSINVIETSCKRNTMSECGMDISLESTSLNKDNWWRIPWSTEELHQLSITMQDFEEAVSKVQPSTKREGFSAIPNVKWEDVGALDSVQKLTEFFISRRIKHPEDYEVLGLDMDTGFLLYGPPGCGKTLLAKAVANDAQANFIYIKGPELLNKYVGESEQAVRSLFSRARSCAPCILFFDEMDALAPRRGTDGNAVAERVLNQLLSEMDGAEKRKGVFMIGATNRPDMIDPAVLRPGRLGKLLYIPLPDCEGRLSILKALTKKKPISRDVDLATIAAMKQSEGLSGADLAALVNEACVVALQEKCMNSSLEKLEPLLVNHRHFEIALSQVSPSVSKQDLLYYEKLPKKFSRSSIMKGIACEASF